MSVLTAALRPLTLALIAFQQPREIPNLPPPAPMLALRAADDPIQATVQARRNRAHRRNMAAESRAASARVYARQSAIEAERQRKIGLEVGRVQAALNHAQAAQNQAIAQSQQAAATANMANAIRQYAQAVAGYGRNPYCSNCGQFGHYSCAAGKPLFFNPYGLDTPPLLRP
jgi:hypothetical protein